MQTSAQGKFSLVSRYYFHLQSLNAAHPAVSFSVEILATLQLLTFFLPPTAGAYPWDYARMWPLWYALNATARGDRLLQFCGAGGNVVLAVVAGVFVGRLGCAGAAAVRLKGNSESEFDESASFARYRKHRFLLLTDYSLCLLTSELLALPAVSLSCAYSFDTANPPSARALGILALFATVVLVVTDRINTCDVKWTRRGLGALQPGARAWHTLCDVCIAVGANAFSGLATAAITAVFSICKVAHVYLKTPYQSPAGNDILSFQGLLALLVLVLVSLPSSDHVVLPSLSLCFLAPALYLCNALTRRRWVKFRQQWADSNSDRLHFALLDLVNRIKDGADAAELAAEYESTLSQFPIPQLALTELLEIGYFSQMAGNRYLMRVTIAMLGRQRATWLTSTAIETCTSRLLFTVNASDRTSSITPDEIVVKYIDFQTCSAMLTEHDLTSMSMLRNFYFMLISRTESFEKVTRLAQELNLQLKATEKMYKASIKVFEKKLGLVKTYKSFLEIIGRKEKV